jgi:uncharacterized protein (DUF983 family)
MEPRTAFSSILNCKCPQCREGKVFTQSNAYHPKFGDTEPNCSNCGLRYEMEQGFWYGAMYISYAFGVAMAIPIMAILSFFTELEIYEISFIVMVTLILTMPLLFRYSRSAWLHIFVRYDKTAVDKFRK